MIRFEKDDPFVLRFKMMYDEKFQMINLIQRGGKRFVRSDSSNIPTTMKKAYSGPLSISKEKKEDFIWMCRNLIIDQEYHQFYEQIATHSAPQLLPKEKSEKRKKGDGRK